MLPIRETKNTGKNKGRYIIDKILPLESAIDCYNCGSTEFVKNTNFEYLKEIDPEYIEKFETPPELQIDIYCRKCGSFICSYFPKI